MKKLFPVALITVFGLLTFASCSKKSSSSSCTCKYKVSTTKDSSFSFSSAGSFSSLTAACDTFNSIYSLQGTGYGCHL